MATAAAFWAQVPGSAPYTPVAGFYTFPCSSTPTVSFSFGGSNVQHKVALNDFNLGYVDHAGGKCLGAYIGADTGLGSRTVRISSSLECAKLMVSRRISDYRRHVQ